MPTIRQIIQTARTIDTTQHRARFDDGSGGGSSKGGGGGASSKKKAAVAATPAGSRDWTRRMAQEAGLAMDDDDGDGGDYADEATARASKKKQRARRAAAIAAAEGKGQTITAATVGDDKTGKVRTADQKATQQRLVQL